MVAGIGGFCLSAIFALGAILIVPAVIVMVRRGGTPHEQAWAAYKTQRDLDYLEDITLRCHAHCAAKNKYMGAVAEWGLEHIAAQSAQQTKERIRQEREGTQQWQQTATR